MVIITFMGDTHAIYYSQNINLLLTEREGRTGEYWPEVVAVRTERSEVRTKTTEGQYSPVRSSASEVSKWFIIWHHFSYETTLPVVYSSQFPARCQGKKPAILTGFRISLMIVAVDKQKLAWLLNENCSASIICVSFSSSCTTQETVLFENTSSLWAETIRGKRRIMKRPR